MAKRLTGDNTLAYLGVNALTPSDFITVDRAPTANDYLNYEIGTFWLDSVNEDIYVLTNKDAQVATWSNFGGGTGGTSFVTDAGTATVSAGALNIFGTANIHTSGATDTVTLTLEDDLMVTSVTATGDLVSSGGDIGTTVGDILSGASLQAVTFVDAGTSVSAATTITAGTGMTIQAGTLTVDSFSAGVVQSDAVGLLFSDNGTNGQVLIGGGAAPVWATITSSGGTITITNGANTINLEASSPSFFPFTEVTAASATMAANNGYIANRATTVTLTLPAVAALGSTIEVVGKGVGSWLIAQGVGQSINFGIATTTVGVGGSLESLSQFDAIRMVCTVANTTWTVLSSIGNITIV